MPTRESKPFDLIVPADVGVFQETSIFPRANGYLRKQYVDIGQHVKGGQLLAEIESPEIDADLNQARASLDEAKANYAKSQNDFDLAQRTYKARGAEQDRRRDGAGTGQSAPAASRRRRR